MGLYNNPMTKVEYEDAPDEPGVMETNPAIALGAAITAVLQALFLILRAAGVGVTKDLEDGVIALISGLLMFPLLTGYLIRFFVFSPATHEAAVEAAFDAGMQTVAPQALPEGSN